MAGRAQGNTGVAGDGAGLPPATWVPGGSTVEKALPDSGSTVSKQTFVCFARGTMHHLGFARCPGAFALMPWCIGRRGRG